jgi:hypothetical protein
MRGLRAGLLLARRASARAPPAAAAAAAALSSAAAGGSSRSGGGASAAAVAAGPFPPPPLSDDGSSWTEEVGAAPLDPRRRVYCNRSLNMRSIRAVGFDMDYTLASYVSETFEALAHAATVAKLVAAFGYPAAPLRALAFDPHYMARGLVIDKARGNVLKVDRHRYVKLAHHGFRALERDARVATYNDAAARPAFDDEAAFAMIDT